MSKPTASATCLVLLLLSGTVLAAEGAQAAAQPWEFGSEVSHFTYREPGLMKEEGTFLGFDGAYTCFRNRLMLRAEAKVSFGDIHYSSPISGQMDGIDDFIFETRGLTGLRFPVFAATTLTPYAGVGYRRLEDDGSGHVTDTGAAGYDRQSNYIYSPLGLRSMTDLGNGWLLGATAEYDFFWWGRQESHMYQALPFLPDVVNHQRSGYGARGSIKLTRNLGTWAWSIEPFIRYWNIQSSSVDDGYFEPHNKSTDIGILFAVEW